MEKILAFDIGDVWTGTAITDALCLLAKPLVTVQTKDLTNFIIQTTKKYTINTIVIGNPITLRGTQSKQTQKTVALKESLEKQFPYIRCILWDERLTSKMAATIKQAKTKEEKIHSHSIAAAIILTAYLDYLHHQKQSSDQ